MHSSPRAQSHVNPALVRSDWLFPLLAGVAARLFFVFLNDLDEGDWISRTINARDFARGTFAIWARTPWPEGNYLLPAIPISLGGDAYWSVRVFCALFSALAIPLVFMAGRTFGGRQGARIAAWTLAFLPFHIYISANGAMTEGPFLVFVLGAIVCAIAWAQAPERGRWLIGSALCVVGAEAFRFDGVFVGASIGFIALLVRDERGFVIRRRTGLAAVATFAVLALAYPIALVISWTSLYGDPLYMVKYAAENTTQFFSAGGHQRWPRWFYITYCVVFWPLVGPVFALTPLVWLASWIGVWRNRHRTAVWFLVTPILVLTCFYMRAALSYTLLNQLRYVTALSVPLLACLWSSIAMLSASTRRRVVYGLIASIAAVQIIPIDAAWHERGVLSRQLGPYALLRPGQGGARKALAWIEQRAVAGQAVVFSPHAASPWLALVPSHGVARVRQLNIYRTSNLVYDSAGLSTMIRDSLRSADWLVVSSRSNTQGLRDGLVTELVRPIQSGQGGALTWQGIDMRPAADFGSMRVFRLVRAPATPVAGSSRP